MTVGRVEYGNRSTYCVWVVCGTAAKVGSYIIKNPLKSLLSASALSCCMASIAVDRQPERGNLAIASLLSVFATCLIGIVEISHQEAVEALREAQEEPLIN